MSNQDILLRILRLLNSRCIDLETIKDRLRMSKEELDTGLTILETHGYIEKINYRNDCRTCAVYSKCNSTSPNLYRITEKGLRLIMRETQLKEQF
jgi:DNA-binding IclR family transcriptional regulator